MNCSHFKKPGNRDQNCLVRNRSIGKLPLLALKHAWCSLHRTNQHDNISHFVQRWGTKHGTSRHYTAKAPLTPYQQRYWWMPTALPHHRQRLQLTSYIFSSQLHWVLPSSTSSAFVSSPASSCFASTTTADASSSPPKRIGYSFIAGSSNDINTHHLPTGNKQALHRQSAS